MGKWRWVKGEGDGDGDGDGDGAGVPCIECPMSSVTGVSPVFCSCLNLSPHNHHSKQNPPCNLFIFGDSILDVGNNNYINTSTLDQANFYPYGINFFPVPTGRFSDGRLISDFIAKLAHLPLIPPYLQPGLHQFSHGVNFASAGGGALVETFQHSEIYKIGGRKFGFLNVLPIGCAPALRLIANANGECLKDVVTYTRLHNEAIFQALQQLANKLPGFKWIAIEILTKLATATFLDIAMKVQHFEFIEYKGKKNPVSPKSDDANKI
ncbi:hypothetical protein KSS87_021880 [Heliosperma pusillum]|nr:hypothetical protein KSS87_021880 [Heliosperma pusillum]